MKLYFEKKLEWIPIKLQEIFYLWDYISLIIQRKEIGRGGSDETVQNNAEREYQKRIKVLREDARMRMYLRASYEAVTRDSRYAGILATRNGYPS